MPSITDILRSTQGGRYFNDGPPTWSQRGGGSKTKEAAERESDHLAKALRRDGEDDALELADVLYGCMRPDDPCLDGACPICGRAAQRLLVHACQPVYREHRKNMFAVNIIWGNAAIDYGDLDGQPLFRPLRAHLTSALADLRIPAIVGFDVSANEHENGAFNGHWMPHAWMLVPGREIELVEMRFRRRFPPDDLTRFPVVMKKFDGNFAGIAYALKSDFYRRISIEFDKPRNRPIWREKRIELAFALHREGLNRRLLLHGFDLVARRGDVRMERVDF